MTPVDAVLFDYGMVLSGPPDLTAWDAMKTELGATEDAFHEAYWEYRDAYDRGALSGITYWNAVGERLGRGLNNTQRANLIGFDIALWTQPNDEMIAWAAALQRAGIRTGILSNIGDAMETGIRQRFPWIEEFRHHTFSHRLGIAKPDPAIYAHAAEGLGVPREHILFVDDREENIAAALAAGMQAIQYSGHSAFITEMKCRGLTSLLTPVQ